MIISNYLKNTKELLLIAALFFGLQSFFKIPVQQSRTSYLVPPQEIKYLAAGLKPQYADSFWLRALQDMDYCEEALAKNLCKSKSWLFSVINLTVDLDSKFKEAYYYGALALTVLVSDYEGATIIFDKGFLEFPTDWPLAYAAGYHALIEEKNKQKASKYYLAAVENGAPSWVRLLAGRLAAESGDTIKASDILKTMIENESDERWVEKLKKKIEESVAQSK